MSCSPAIGGRRSGSGEAVPWTGHGERRRGSGKRPDSPVRFITIAQEKGRPVGPPFFPSFFDPLLGRFRRLRPAALLALLGGGGGDFEGQRVVLQPDMDFAAMDQLAEQQFLGQRLLDLP